MSHTRRAPVATVAWARALVRTTPARVPWDRVLLTGVGITAPVSLSLLLAPGNDEMISLGALASMGALVVSAMDVGSAGIQRVHRMTFAATAATIGFLIGTAVYGHHVLTFLGVIVAGILSGIAGAVSATASKSAVYFLMFSVMAANTDFGLASHWTAPLIFFLGAVWRVLLTALAAAYRGRSFAPEREAVAQVYVAMVDQLVSEESAGSARAGTALTGALNDAYDVLGAARTELAVHDPRWQALVAILNASAPVVDAVIASAEEEVTPDAASLSYLRAVASWVTDPAAPLPAAYLAPSQNVRSQALASSLVDLSRALIDIDSGGVPIGRGEQSLPSTPTTIARLRSLARSLASGSELWSSILRLALCLAVAQSLSIILQLERPYLVMLTVAQVMKPDFGSVLGRAVQRGLGTLIGVGVATFALVLVPRGPGQVAIIFLLAACIPIVMPRNYGLYSVVTTPLAVLLVELHASDSSGLVEARVLDTLLGCSIVLLLGYLPWPQTWHAPRHLALHVAELVTLIGSYADVALRESTELDRANARRSVYRRTSDLRTSISQSMAEPPRISTATAAWLPDIAALERVADAITAVATDAAVSGVPVEPHSADATVAALASLAEVIVRGRPHQEVVLPGDVPDRIARELAEARSSLTKHERVHPGDVPGDLRRSMG